MEELLLSAVECTWCCVRQTEMHTAEPLVPEPSPFNVEVVGKLERYKSSGIDQILAEIIQAGSNTLHSEIHELINSCGLRKTCPSSGRSICLCMRVFMCVKGDETD